MPLGVHGEPVQDWCLNAACSLGQVDRQSVNSATPSAYVYGKPAWGRRLRARRAVRTNRGRGGAHAVRPARAFRLGLCMNSATFRAPVIT